jgi:hypothetical protein
MHISKGLEGGEINENSGQKDPRKGSGPLEITEKSS